MSPSLEGSCWRRQRRTKKKGDGATLKPSLGNFAAKMYLGDHRELSKRQTVAAMVRRSLHDTMVQNSPALPLTILNGSKRKNYNTNEEYPNLSTRGQVVTEGSVCWVSLLHTCPPTQPLLVLEMLRARACAGRWSPLHFAGKCHCESKAAIETDIGLASCVLSALNGSNPLQVWTSIFPLSTCRGLNPGSSECHTLPSSVPHSPRSWKAQLNLNRDESKL